MPRRYLPRRHPWAAALGALILAAGAAAWPAKAQSDDDGFSFGAPEGEVVPSNPPEAEARDPRVEQAERYAACLRLARSAPDKALERARTWADTGGGDPARHCEAVAHMTRGDYPRAGRMLEELARTMEKGFGARPRVNALSQASRAWLLADRPGRAEAVATQAIELAPKDVELLIDRAHARFQAGRYWEAIDDLNRAEELAPERADILVYRGSAYRYVDAPTMAQENLRRALEMDPGNPEALFELGALNRIQGDTAAARRRWMQLIRQNPDHALAQAARENLHRMDVQVEGGSDG
jgi:tetratricopeptide (TPR) repeat protein